MLGYIEEGEPLAIGLPNRNASIYMSSHFRLDDFPASSESLSDEPLPHTHLNPAEAFEDAREEDGYRGTPFPRRDFLRPRPFAADSDSELGADPGQALRQDGLALPDAPSLGDRVLGGLQRAEAAAGAAAGVVGSVASIAAHSGDLYHHGLRGRQWLDRTLRIPRTPEGLAPPPDEVAPPQIIGWPSEVEPLLERAGQRAAEVERQAAQDIEAFTQGQMAEAEAEGFASAAEAAASRAEAAAAAEATGGGALAAIGSGLAAAGEAALPVAATVGAAAGGLAVAGAGAALVGTAWALHGGMLAAEHFLGWGEGGGGTDSDQSRPSSAVDVQTLNGMQEAGAQQHFSLREQRPRLQVFRMDADSEAEPRAQPPPRLQSRQARQPALPFGLNPGASSMPRPQGRSSGSDSSAAGRQSRRSSRASLPEPSFDQLRSDLELA